MGPATYSKMVRALALLRNNQSQGVTMKTLMQELECSRSTVERVFAELRNANFDIVDRYTVGDDHRTKRWILSKEALLSNPASAQLFALSLTQRIALEHAYRNSKDHDLRDALSKVLALQDALPRARALDVEELVSRNLQASSVGPKQRINSDILEVLQEALVGGYCLQLSYNAGAPRLVMPHGIVRSRFHYLVARSHDNVVRTYRLDLVSSVTLSDEIIVEPDDWSFSDWVGASFGIFHGDETITAVLQFDAEVADRAERLVFHPSQWQRRQDDGTLLIYLRCCGHRELLHEILHPDWLGRVQVMGPPALREELTNFLYSTLEKNGLSKE